MSTSRLLREFEISGKRTSQKHI
jgi:hypothetical protein